MTKNRLFSNSDYVNYLKAICSLSRLFTESNIPYLYYRVAENIFCKAFGAENLSRDNLAYDARVGEIGIGVKTFIDKGTNPEKITEFNVFSNQLRRLNGNDLAVKLAELRNERIDFANRTYGIKSAVYHCIARKEKSLRIFETDYDLIDIPNIKKTKSREASILFEDGKNEYSFNFSKTTLFKKFYTPRNALIVDIEILNDPLALVLQLFNQQITKLLKRKIKGVNFVILPLYSLRESKIGHKVVSAKSGLNQWNAGGRPRDTGEVYIPVPKTIHNKFPRFFPSRETPFNLHLPTSEVLNAKLCQENSKALMTNPNNALSDWLLRKVLKLKDGELLTYERLRLLGIDSVRITKINDQNFKIDFTKINSFDDFVEDKDETEEIYYDFR
ncbi:MAG: restriction endonuclease [Planctomycetes bacterium]|nr:restriction endonuclease [Planctomycetota bacterium]